MGSMLVGGLSNVVLSSDNVGNAISSVKNKLESAAPGVLASFLYGRNASSFFNGASTGATSMGASRASQFSAVQGMLDSSAYANLDSNYSVDPDLAEGLSRIFGNGKDVIERIGGSVAVGNIVPASGFKVWDIPFQTVGSYAYTAGPPLFLKVSHPLGLTTLADLDNAYKGIFKTAAYDMQCALTVSATGANAVLASGALYLGAYFGNAAPASFTSYGWTPVWSGSHEPNGNCTFTATRFGVNFGSPADTTGYGWYFILSTSATSIAAPTSTTLMENVSGSLHLQPLLRCVDISAGVVDYVNADGYRTVVTSSGKFADYVGLVCPRGDASFGVSTIPRDPNYGLDAVYEFMLSDPTSLFMRAVLAMVNASGDTTVDGNMPDGTDGSHNDLRAAFAEAQGQSRTALVLSVADVANIVCISDWLYSDSAYAAIDSSYRNNISSLILNVLRAGSAVPSINSSLANYLKVRLGGGADEYTGSR
jgi:hypothetical protein